jgi:hypothetical protein
VLKHFLEIMTQYILLRHNVLSHLWHIWYEPDIIWKAG